MADENNDYVIEFSIKISKNGDITNDVATYDSSFAEVYAAFHQIRAEVDRQIKERRACPFNPKYGSMRGDANTSSVSIAKISNPSTL